MKKSKVYTKTGDKGSTALVSGTRLSKADDRIDLYGDLDELNSFIGLGLSNLGVHFQKVIELNHKIQSAIFDLGSNLACEAELRTKYNLPQIHEDLIQLVENEIDLMDSTLKPLKSFVLPGGHTAACAFHVVRTITRRVERKLIGYHEMTKEELPINSQVLLNRLSDYYFVLARYINQNEQAEEIYWIPNN